MHSSQKANKSNDVNNEILARIQSRDSLCRHGARILVLKRR